MQLLSQQVKAARKPRLRMPNAKDRRGAPPPGTTGKKRGRPPILPQPDASKAATAFDNDTYLLNKQNKEKYLTDRAKVSAELEELELAARRRELVTMDEAQKQLEREHGNWLNVVEELRQAIAKRIGKVGIPVEVQEVINEMILKEITRMRQIRAAME